MNVDILQEFVPGPLQHKDNEQWQLIASHRLVQGLSADELTFLAGKYVQFALAESLLKPLEQRRFLFEDGL